MSAVNDIRTSSDGWYPVQIRQYGTVPCEDAAQIAGLPMQSITLSVQPDAGGVPVFPEIDAQIEAQRYAAARTAMGAVANGTDWPPRTYLVTVEGRHSSSAYVAMLGEHREFTLKAAKEGDWPF